MWLKKELLRKVLLRENLSVLDKLLRAFTGESSTLSEVTWRGVPRQRFKFRRFSWHTQSFPEDTFEILLVEKKEVIYHAEGGAWCSGGCPLDGWMCGGWVGRRVWQECGILVLKDEGRSDPATV